MLALIFPVIAPVLVAAAIGYSWARAGRPFDTDTVTNLVLTVGVPFLVVDVLMNADISPDAMGDMAVAAVVSLVGSALVGLLVLKILRQPIQAFLPSMIFGNTGNMALPLCLFAFGKDGLALAIGYFTIVIVVQVSATTLISSNQRNWRTIVLNPMAWAAALALSLKFGGYTLPLWISNTVHLLGAMTIPIMLIALGVSLARLKVTSLGRSLFLGGLKIVLGFALGYATVLLLDLEGIARGVVLVQSAMPAAVFNYLFAARFNQRPEEVAGVVILSTLVSFATLPLLLWIAMEGTVVAG
ncbi:MAG: AEC family transporter [Rhodospirillum sp.]|nr:AEC family transporter [Rhodospirillum sp.]MCF8490459.1 AEC family transporter [Rhodospirillum sp.]MCF8500844.1 AEC family transporter [Rhodospirillum sp.]